MDKIANTKREIRVFQSRVVIAALFIIVLSLVLISRIYNLQIINYDYYTAEALGNQLQQLPITPTRGDILDRNGKILASNTLSYKLTITPEKVKDMDATMFELKYFDLINDDDIEQFYKTE
jgi:penicillin-binding protein 2